MNVIKIMAVFLFVITTVSAQEIQFKEEIIDFGRVAYGTEGNKVFEFTNVGSEPLVIKEVKSNCGCTVPRKPEKPIMPGKKSYIEVAYDTKRIGGFMKSLVVYSNSKEQRKVIKIKGFVEKINNTVVSN
ncbi:Protein of unknown function [Tenacibaculum sp. MAR_2009_124]|uniref:DUF1573 domain-containing protein n=1 Tax=Tenacibaculum sp. MAR_2009_124 TaxID=1250059 RepID=UPI000898F232|nr:DUF1573 domain-containing protein [Tenacibaculum sp. MAR_2009_124]SEC38472.1 Protein of unknown function [Tenacibaculum sp. MAR_2009_124]